MPKFKNKIKNISRQPVTRIINSEKIVLLLEPEDLVRGVFSGLVDEIKLISRQWGFAVFNCRKNKIRFTVVFCPPGNSNIDIAVNELAKAGGRIFLRAGCCGGIDKKLKVGDLIILKSALKKEALSRDYGEKYPLESYPSKDIVKILAESANKINKKYSLGKSITVNNLYAFNHIKRNGKLIPMTFNEYETPQKEILEGAIKQKVSCVEMESASLFVLCDIFGLKSGALLAVSDRVPWESKSPFNFTKSYKELFKVIIIAIQDLIKNGL